MCQKEVRVLCTPSTVPTAEIDTVIVVASRIYVQNLILADVRYFTRRCWIGEMPPFTFAAKICIHNRRVFRS